MKQTIRHILLILGIVSSLSAETITVRMFGMVKEPGVQKIEEGTGLIGLIYQAGGAKFGGCPKSIVIKTIGDGTSTQVEVDAYRIVMQGLADVPLKENQTIWIPENVIPCLSPEQIREFNQRLPIYLKIDPNER